MELVEPKKMSALIRSYISGRDLRIEIQEQRLQAEKEYLVIGG